ncbi:MAG: hypothetical protein V2A54_06220 [Bacteroidota bacterium]
MAVYRFRIIIEDLDDFYRDIEIKSKQTFEELHNAIQRAVEFDNKQMASFYMCNQNWQKGQEITLVDMSAEDNHDIVAMKGAILSDYIEDPRQKIMYVFDFLDMWTFYLELVKVIPDAEKGISYPRITKSVGKAPKQDRGVPNLAAKSDEMFFDDEYTGSLTEESIDEDDLSDDVGIVSEGEETEAEADEQTDETRY